MPSGGDRENEYQHFLAEVDLGARQGSAPPVVARSGPS
jgi:hypothetical protein